MRVNRANSVAMIAVPVISEERMSTQVGCKRVFHVLSIQWAADLLATRVFRVTRGCGLEHAEHGHELWLTFHSSKYYS